MIKLTLHLWSKLQDPKCLEERQSRASSFSRSHHSESILNRPNIVSITMHDVNIEETKCETLVLVLSLFLWSS